MTVYENGQFDKKDGCVLALGSFDALHSAHIKLIKKTIDEANVRGVRAGVHMFCERIEKVIFPQSEHKSIYTNEQRVKITEQIGADFVYFEKFDTQFMNMSAFDFAKMLKEKFDVKCVVAGFDYTFGRGREGDATLLEKYGALLGFDVVITAALEYEGEIISSTKIRTLIQEGNVSDISALLAREYSLTGAVVHDRGVGRTMGLPTANIRIDDDVLLLKNGVYAAYTIIGEKKYPCVVNIGVRPTFELSNVSVEAHIIDFDKDLYGKSITLYFLKRLRDEKKFDTKEALAAQILQDIDKSRTLFTQKTQ